MLFWLTVICMMFLLTASTFGELIYYVKVVAVVVMSWITSILGLLKNIFILSSDQTATKTVRTILTSKTATPFQDAFVYVVNYTFQTNKTLDDAT